MNNFKMQILKILIYAILLILDNLFAIVKCNNVMGTKTIIELFNGYWHLVLFKI